MRRRAWFVAIIAVAVLWQAVPASAAGERDTSFSTDGKVTTDVFGPHDDYLNDLAVDASGRTVAVGSWGGGSLRKNFAVVRYAQNGSLDNTFGSGGRVLTDFDGDDDVASAVAIQPDGKILVAGSARVGTNNTDFALARYLPDGSRDPAFSDDGRVTTNWGVTERALDVTLTPQGGIVVVGYSNRGATSQQFAVLKYMPNGDRDNRFSDNGFTTAGLGADDYAHAVTIQPDGKILAVGMRSEDDEDDCFGCNDWDLAFARWTASGDLDPSFDGDGKKTEGLGGDESLSDVKVGRDGRIYVAGDWDGWLLWSRYNSDGSLSVRRTFDVAGKGQGESLAMLPDGKFVIGGTGRGDLVALRLTSSGTRDNSFDADGLARTDFDHRLAYPGGMAIQPDGKIVVGGSVAVDGEDLDFALTRFLP